MVRKSVSFLKKNVKWIAVIALAVFVLGTAMGSSSVSNGGLQFRSAANDGAFAASNSSRCYDCERGTDAESRHLSGKSKCFECETQIGKSDGWASAGAAQSSKCYTCGDHNPLLFRDGIMRNRRPIL